MNTNENNALESLYAVVCGRKKEPQEGSYTCYLFEKGLDKILKKVGEESAETIIAAKNGDRELLCGEVADLMYHVVVMLAECGLPYSEVEAELERRAQKIGNLKVMKNTDRNT